jgi:hypothetical protein
VKVSEYDFIDRASFTLIQMRESISRRDFLKLLGYGAAISLGSLLNFSALTELKKMVPILASAQSSGSWAFGNNASAIPIHAAVLNTGKIFYLAGSGTALAHSNGPFEARILDLNAASEKTLPLTEDLFCIGLTHLASGNVLLAGGTKMYDSDPDNCNGKWHGLNAVYELDITSEALISVCSMAHGRWYPTLVTLADGKAVIMNGFDEYGSYNTLVEIYDPASKTCIKKFDPNTSTTYCVGKGSESECPGAGSPCYGGPGNGVAPNVGLYPRMHLMPNGLIITCGAQVTVWSWDPANGKWGILTQTSVYRGYGTSFLLPLHNMPSERGKILVVGGSVTPDSYATKSTEILDFDAGTSTNPVVRQGAETTYGRRFLAPVILPNGKCIILGGSEKGLSIPVYTPEMFDPVTETWETLPAASVARLYHQVSLLLPDGRVWTAGSQPGAGVSELRTELFSPSYLFQGPRPVISGLPNVGDYGGTISIPTPDALTVNSVSLVRLMSCTHHYEANQRLIWLQIASRTSNNLTVSAPINSNIAPPGYYMIFILNASGVPSVARIIKIPGGPLSDTTAPGQVTGLVVAPPVSDTQLNLNWNARTEPDLNHYNVYRGTVPNFPVVLGTTTPVGQPTTNSFPDTGLTGSTTYYYKVSAVDTTGNIGILSTESSGTTASGAVIFYNVPIPGDGFAGLQAGSSIRYGEEANTVSSLLVGKSLKTWKVRLRKRTNPSGNVTARVRRRSDDAIVATFNEIINSTTLNTSFAEYTFTLTTPYTVAAGDRIMIEYSGPAAVDIELWITDQFDGANTRRVRYTTTYSFANTTDVTGSMSNT